ncbi:MAG: hypothetical protein CL840_18820 [Crocinitomicaceae bacterium]|nr:hypothetical protein [Crocinitomicaceae bacterium]|tara:strand:+ start:11133 stop:11930 length:798 start_codon:yes stop_codon:yes gene_type:complete
MKNTIFIVLLLLSVGCSKLDSTADTVRKEIVVEGILEAGSNPQITLSKVLVFGTDEVSNGDLDSLSVFIENREEVFLLVPDSSLPGSFSNNNVYVEEGQEYILRFNYQSYQIVARTTVPTIPVNVEVTPLALGIPESVTPGSQPKTLVTWDNPNNDYHVIIIEYLETDYNPINESLNEEEFPKYRVVSTDPTNANSYNLDTRRHFLFFGKYKLSVMKLNEEYVNFYENIGQSSLSLSEPISNIENGLGVFTAINQIEINVSVYQQ